MAITISGQNNNDRILASDGVLDQISGFNVVGVMTATTFNVTTKHTANHIDVGSTIQLGNAGIITATTLIGNVTGNVNSTSHLLLQISGSEKFRVGNGGQFGIAGANYGTAGQVFTSGGSGSAPTWSTIASDKITEGNTEAEVVDTGSDGHFKVTTEGSERLRVDSSGRVMIGTTTEGRLTGDRFTIATNGHTGMTIRSGTSAGGNIFFSDGTSGDDELRGVVSYDHTNNFMRFYTNAAERLRIGTSGQIGLSGENYGSSGQVLTSQGSGSAATWSTISTPDADKITEGNTEAEVVDSGSDGHFKVTTEGVQRIRVDSNGLGISSTTTAARNAGVGTAIGTIIFNSTENLLQVYSNDLNWISFSPTVPTLTNVSGTIYGSQTATLTLTGTNFLSANLQVNFIQATRSIDVTVTVTPTNDTTASVSVPASVYNNVQNGDVVTIKVTNSDGQTSNTQTTTAVVLPSGGTITTSGSYRIHTFTSSGNFVNTLSNLSVEYLVIGGGGGGGVADGGGGGGGAGGYRINTGEMSGRRSSSEAAMTINPGTFSVVVGAGGAGNVHGGGVGGPGNAGSNSSFNSIVSNGGGYGGGDTSRNGGSGGSGGAAGRNSTTRGSGTSGQGGDGGRAGGNAGGGGGGAGELLGPDGVGGHTGGRGGNGLNSSITGSSVGRAGGGGGGSESPVNSSGGSASSGGGRGGCAGSIGVAPQAGTANTGGGGGASGDFNSGGNHNGQSGGSGIVIIRYQV